MPEKRKLEFHPSVTFAYSEEAKKFLMSVYDDGYRMKAYVGSANPIGGNPSFDKGDRGPEDTLLREIKAEYDPDFQGPNGDTLVFGQKVSWASPFDIKMIRTILVNESHPWEDFYVNFSNQILNNGKNGDPPGTGLYSVYYAEIPIELIEIVSFNLRNKKTISNEGGCGVFSLDDLVKSELGEFSIAHAATPMFNKLFDVKVPFPKEVIVESLGHKPGPSFKDYLNDFEYSRESPKPGRPSFHDVIFGKS